MIRIFVDKHLTDERLRVRRGDGQVDLARRLCRAEGQCALHCPVDIVDAGLVDGAAGRVAQEVVLGGDDHGGMGRLWFEVRRCAT